MFGINFYQCEKEKTCSAWPKFDLPAFEVSTVKSVIQRAALIGKLKSFDLHEIQLELF